MIPDIKKFNESNHRDIIDLLCDECMVNFKRIKKNVLTYNLPAKRHFCSIACKKHNSIRLYKTKVSCDNCGLKFIKRNFECKKTKTNFCGLSCAAKFRQAHKTKGVRRSKLEVWLEQKLIEIFPNQHFIFNDRELINSELDIYIPSLSLAFELNGIFHYEPIYGKEKLLKIQNNDNRKFQACAEHGISLCIIDTSQQKKFKENTAQKYLNIIIEIINNKMAEG